MALSDASLRLLELCPGDCPFAPALWMPPSTDGIDCRDRGELPSPRAELGLLEDRRLHWRFLVRRYPSLPRRWMILCIRQIRTQNRIVRVLQMSATLCSCAAYAIWRQTRPRKTVKNQAFGSIARALSEPPSQMTWLPDCWATKTRTACWPRLFRTKLLIL